MSEQDKRCGTCRFWINIWNDDSIGDCGVILPHSLVAPEQEMMTANEGASCPCWEPK